MNGITGMIAPSPVEIPAASAACAAVTAVAGVAPNSSTDERLQHRVGML